jgi:hypothetical protein
MFGENASKKTCLWLKNLPKLEVYYPDVIPPSGWERVMTAGDMLECEECSEPFCPEHNTHYADCSCIGPTEEGVVYKSVGGVLFANRGNLSKMTWGNQTPSGQNKLGPSDDRWKIRSETYKGVAEAFAKQWSKE